MKNIYALLDELQTIARNGLYFSQDLYDRERYERLMMIATETYEELLSMPSEDIRERFTEEIGYITPKVGSDAAIFNEKDEVLLMDRADGSGWCLPCGWLEPNERPIEAVVREVREETGLEVEAGPLVGVFTRCPSEQNGPHTMVAVVHLCTVVGGELRLSHEGNDLKYWEIDKMENWHGYHKKYAQAALIMLKSGGVLPSISD